MENNGRPKSQAPQEPVIELDLPPSRSSTSPRPYDPFGSKSYTPAPHVDLPQDAGFLVRAAALWVDYVAIVLLAKVVSKPTDQVFLH